jgi:protoheme ferro-lyase
MEEGSPLMVYSRRQQQALARLPDTPVALGMSYGSPSLASAVDDWRRGWTHRGAAAVSAIFLLDGGRRLG